jgi:1,4-alpha-glucan branching enzyme
MAGGSFALVLNAHLPFVRHPAHEDFLEERWLFEAVTETYIPLLEMLGSLDRDRVPTRLTLSLSPTLLGQLADPLLQARYLRHLDRQVELAEKEVRRTRPDARLRALAEMYLARFYRARAVFIDEWQRDLIAAFRAYQQRGLVDLITSAATHGLLPVLGTAAGTVRAQIEVATAEHQRFFGRLVDGFWLPQCAFEPGIDAELARAGVRYTVVDAHAIAYASPRPVYGVYAPVVCDSGVAAFGRDPDATKQVLGAHEGYPLDAAYRDFERDIGFDLDTDYLRPYLPPTGQRVQTGFKYFRNGGRRGGGEPYEPERAREQARRHAEHFVAARRRQVAWLARSMDRPPVLVSAFDAELFGRWWFEGPLWLEQVLRRVAETPELRACTPGDALRERPAVQRATPAASSWAMRGHLEAWLGPQNDWVHRHVHATADRLRALCQCYPSAGDLTRRALTQAARELLLAQASDWPLLMSRDATSEYATRRTRDHLLRCQRLCAEVEQDDVNEPRLAALEDADNIFPTLDYRVFL